MELFCVLWIFIKDCYEYRNNYKTIVWSEFWTEVDHSEVRHLYAFRNSYFGCEFLYPGEYVWNEQELVFVYERAVTEALGNAEDPSDAVPTHSRSPVVASTRHAMDAEGWAQLFHPHRVLAAMHGPIITRQEDVRFISLSTVANNEARILFWNPVMHTQISDIAQKIIDLDIKLLENII